MLDGVEEGRRNTLAKDLYVAHQIDQPSYHQRECGFVDLLQRTQVNETICLALRTVLKTDRQTLINARTAGKLQLEDVYDSADYRTLDNLENHITRMSTS